MLTRQSHELGTGCRADRERDTLKFEDCPDLNLKYVERQKHQTQDGKFAEKTDSCRNVWILLHLVAQFILRGSNWILAKSVAKNLCENGFLDFPKTFIPARML